MATLVPCYWQHEIRVRRKFAGEIAEFISTHLVSIQAAYNRRMKGQPKGWARLNLMCVHHFPGWVKICVGSPDPRLNVLSDAIGAILPKKYQEHVRLPSWS